MFPPPQHILVPLDGSEVAERALPHAGQLARLFGARVTLARVVEPMAVPPAEAAAWPVDAVENLPTAEQVQNYLDTAAAGPLLAGLAVDTCTPLYPVAAGLLDAIESAAVDLVVMTTHGYAGFTRLMLGSVADKVIRHAKTPVYVVPIGADPTRLAALRRLVVPLDGSASAERALDPAVMLAQAAKAQLDLLSIPTMSTYSMVAPEAAGWQPEILRAMADESQAYLSALATRLSAETALRVATSVDPASTGAVAESIVAHVRRVDGDAVVIATHGRGGASRLLHGSVVDHLLRLAERPVWVVRAAG